MLFHPASNTKVFSSMVGMNTNRPPIDCDCDHEDVFDGYSLLVQPDLCPQDLARMPIDSAVYLESP